MSTTSTGERRVIGNVLKGSVGNLIEWYDWYVYAAFSVYFAKEFFPEGDTTAQLLSTAAVFAVGFLMRPIGGWIMGRYADRHGRRSALTLSVTVMAAGSLVIAVTPSYASIGLVAPVMLVIARMLQGLSVGGEYATSATYLAEVASPGRRGFYSSFQYVTLVAGQLIALGVQIILQLTLPAEAMQSWGWRIPFLIGAAGAVAVMWLRRTMDESEAFTDEVEKRDADTSDAGPKEGSLRMLLQYPRECLLVCALTLGGCVAFYTYTTYMQKYMINTSGISKDTVAWINFAALLVFIVLQPIGGALSDRIGRRKLLIFFGIGGTVLTVPLMTVLGKTTNPLVAFGLMMLGLIVVTGYTSVNAIVKTELFPTKVRALGVGLPYALTLAIFGGTVETVALALKRAGHESLFFYYVTGCIAISLVVYFFMRETSDGSPLDRATSREDTPDDDVELVDSRS
ncbi:MHS family alpha-ketoglutarate permease-like MFS transporter [Rhodococcus percolatus]|uniref:MFS transporter n=1 Tax=Rhodococcus opacus TaxID=37919 RepID=UPI0015FD1C78|nr:MFS transporter [Rhodococcus opacus]MBA8962334.1 MHS family alpha-ketoglutarate permease-like MFS transporter [Rhodococcus opacus]MBP2209137.1 MHS family alpha-ketoglutarate permease-like MFS transporter [Rhodococcus opacus]